VDKAKKKVQQQIEDKIPSEQREKTYLVYVDLKKAFDTVDRALLVETMDKNGFDSTFINAYTAFCHNMTLELPDGAQAVTNVGVVQGGVSSPSSFAIMMNPMLERLNELCPTLALADDLVCVAEGRA